MKASTQLLLKSIPMDSSSLPSATPPHPHHHSPHHPPPPPPPHHHPHPPPPHHHPPPPPRHHPPPPPPPRPASAPPPPTPPKMGYFRRILPFFLAANVGIGAYVLLKQSAEKNKEEKELVTSTESAVPEKKSAVEQIPAPTKVLQPIPEQDQRQLYKWILEDKRKVKPRDAAEKKQLDEEKALLKQFIRAKSLPSF